MLPLPSWVTISYGPSWVPGAFSAEEKIRIVLEGMRGEESIAALCRREGLILTEGQLAAPPRRRHLTNGHNQG